MTTQLGKADAGINEISFSMACPKCRGTGTATQRIDFETLERIHTNNPENKIQRIKEVRAMWLFDLKSAKELVEAYDRLLTELTEINYSNT